MQTADIFSLRIKHQLAFEEMQEAVKEEEKRLQRYAAKPNANKEYINGRNSFLDIVARYVNITETLAEGNEVRKKMSDDLNREAVDLINEFNSICENAKQNRAQSNPTA